MPEPSNDGLQAEPEEDAPNHIDADEDGSIRIGDIYIAPPPLPALTFDATGPRLMISDIQIENFKSYGGKVQLGPFHKNFSSIIGPNGSGKSNVIDSMLFVFGYRSQKIRSKTVGVLIHSSDTHPNVTGCSVHVHFQKIIDKSADDFEVVPNSQFVITRSAFKDNSSYYSIDDRRVQFKDVGRLLRSHGIDIDHNRFLILQGEVEQISLMKPKSQTEHDTGLLEFLEDIIGSGRFQEPIAILAKRVEDLNQERSEKLNRVKAVEKEKDDLEGPKNEAMEYYKAKNEITIKKNSVFQRIVYDLQKENNKMEVNLKASEEALGVLIDQFKEIDAKVNKREEETGPINEQFQESCKKVDEVAAKFTALELEDVHRREDLKHRKSKVKELVQTLENESNKLVTLKKEPGRLEAAIKELDSHKVRLDADKVKAEAKYNKEMASIHSETKSLQEEKDKHEEKLIDLQKTVDEVKSRMDIAQVELDLYVKNELTEKTKLAELQHSHEQALNTVAEKQKEIADIKKTLPAIEKACRQDRQELEQVTLSEQQTSGRFQQQRAKLEETRSSVQSSRNTGRLLQAIMAEKASGRIPGIVGRLGDLGAIAAKYDVAMSTACRQLDNIVTDNLATAQQCVLFLKANNLGQATFIGLDKMATWVPHTTRKITTPENVPRLFDLIKVKDPSILPAFYFATRDTLVADDITQATRIGLQGGTRHRVVTLQGEMIEISGTMSGGGGAPLRGRMGTALVAEACTPEQLEAMEREVAELKQEAGRLRERRGQLQEKIADHESTASQLRNSLELCQMQMTTLSGQEPALRSQIAEQERRAKEAAPDKRVVAQLTKKVESEKKQFDAADGKAATVKDAIKVLHDNIVEIGGSKMKAAQKLLGDVKKKIDATVSDANRNAVAIKTATRNIAKTEALIVSTTAEIEEHRAAVVRLKQELTEADTVAVEVIALSNECKAEKGRLEKIINDIKEGLKELNVRRHELEVKKLESKHQHDKSKILLAEALHRVARWKKDISKLVIEEVDGVEAVELPTLTEEELQHVSPNREEVYVLEDNLKNMKPNISAIAEFKRKENVYLERVAELDDITKRRDSQRRCHEELRKQRLTEFMTGFQIITYKLKETYQMLTLGGDAELELVNSLDPFSDGIVFSVRPSRKSWKNISNLSGGEKTLSSLALVFALHYYKPTPFYVMDEIDAALDFRNVSIVGHYIKEQTKNAQFIVISLRNNMFELADRLVGIFKIRNTSDSVAIDPRSQVE